MPEPLDKPNGYQGYFRPQTGQPDEELTAVGPGTPCGEYMRRYWQPVAMASEVADLPVVVRVLAETLVLFKDKSGRYGLVHKHCAHRGASLEYGIVAERGIICCYHGWHYDIDGTLIRAGSEPDDSPIHRDVTQGAYPVREQHGLLFAYLGPPDEMPELPEYDTQHLADTEAVPFSITTPCNWLQVYENTQDPIHVLHLHARSSGVQFGAASGVDQVIEYRDTPLGMVNIQTRHIGNHAWTRLTDSILPNGNQTGAIFEEAREPKFFRRVSILRWMVPVDDTMTVTIGWRFFNSELDPDGLENRTAVGKESIDFIGQTQDERPYEERQRQPGDYEAQVSQRPTAIHALEHLGTSDRGVTTLRRLIRNAIRGVAAGERAPHPRIRDDALVATYCQDTVWPWPVADGVSNDERAQLKALGAIVANAVLDSAGKPHAARVAQVERACADSGE